MGQLTTGLFAPIEGRNLKQIVVSVDTSHPITKAFLERLPQTSDSELPVLLAYLRGGPDNADVRSWIDLVEGEIAHRKTNPLTLVQMIIAATNKKGTV